MTMARRRLPPSDQRPDGHHRRPLGTRRRRGHPQATRHHRQRRLRGVLAIPPRPRTTPRPRSPLPQPRNPSRVTGQSRSLQKSHTPTADDRSARLRRSRPACASPRRQSSAAAWPGRVQRRRCARPEPRPDRRDAARPDRRQGNRATRAGPKNESNRAAVGPGVDRPSLSGAVASGSAVAAHSTAA